MTVPRPTDNLIISMDASPANKGIGSTLFVERNHQRFVAEFFSAKLEQHQINWMPCEHEALAISTSTTHFGPFIIESIHPTKILTNSKPCKEAHDRLRNGYFSASARISTFLSTLSTYNVTVEHVRGTCNKSSDYSSRNPQECLDKECQICKFVHEQTTATVRSTVSDILLGALKMPFTNQVAWKSAQHECKTLRRVYAHLTQGTRPAKKARNLRDLRRYLQIATVDDRGLLIVKRSVNR